MKKFSIKIRRYLIIYYNHYLSYEFIKEEECYDDFKERYPLSYSSRGFDKPAVKRRSGTYYWLLDSKDHRVGKPACIYSDGYVWYYKNREEVK